MKRLCVFCGSTKGSLPIYERVTRELGEQFLKRGIGLVYGGGNIGLMGIMAETVLKGGGEVIGIIPKALAEKELAFRELADLRIVQTMHERKALMEQLSDGFIALPGGFGTLEEICEMVTWAQLNIHSKPCGLLNIEGFYDDLLSFMDNQVQQGFVTPVNRYLVMEALKPEHLLDLLQGKAHTEISSASLDRP
ncbi:MAG: TIGR00730 family Rossman fold protein [Nitrospirales bacterium]|nr:TIGR00730 family Rossman fold protein [Nitrospira sp.]MDR4501658.1 TIGR00730 family Rossman fold protein [Nitrospirales bacterium]